MKSLRQRLPRAATVVIALTVSALAVSASFLLVDNVTTNHAVAYFVNSTGLYEGDPVAIAGVPVGSIDKIVPDGDRVRIEFSIDGDYSVPSDVRAAIISPTLVTGRYIQLSPAYTGGDTMDDGAVIPLEKTAVPVEFDELKNQLASLAAELGPEGLNRDGSVNDFLSKTSDALSGNGATLGDTVNELSRAAQTLDTSATDIFATIRNLQSFVSALAANDDQVGSFVRELASLSALLNDNRTEFDSAINALVPTLEQVQTFIADNRDQLSTDVSQLVDITQLLVNRQDDIAKLLHVAPTALSDLYNIWDPDANSLTGALMVPDRVDPLNLVCGLLTTVGAPQDQCARAAQTLGSTALYSTVPPPAGNTGAGTVADLTLPTIESEGP